MTEPTFSELTKTLYNYLHPKTGQKAGLVSQDHYDTVMRNKEKLDAAVCHERDFDYDYFGFKTMEKSYLLRMHGKIVERPQAHTLGPLDQITLEGFSQRGDTLLGSSSVSTPRWARSLTMC